MQKNIFQIGIQLFRKKYKKWLKYWFDNIWIIKI